MLDTRSTTQALPTPTIRRQYRLGTTQRSPEELHRQTLIRGVGEWLRDNPEIVDLEGQASSGTLPRTVRFSFTFPRDPDHYCIFFSRRNLDRAHFCVQFHRTTKWDPVHTLTLADYETGEDLADAIMQFFLSPTMDCIFRWHYGEAY
jgi:hypothetical protein